MAQGLSLEIFHDRFFSDVNRHSFSANSSNVLRQTMIMSVAEETAIRSNFASLDSNSLFQSLEFLLTRRQGSYMVSISPSTVKDFLDLAGWSSSSTCRQARRYSACCWDARRRESEQE